MVRSFNSLAEFALSCISRSWKSRSLSRNLSSISLYSRMACIFSFLISKVSFSALFTRSSNSYLAFSFTLHWAHCLFAVDFEADSELRFCASSRSFCFNLRTFSDSWYFFLISARSCSSFTFSCLSAVKSRIRSLALAFFLSRLSRSARMSTSSWLSSWFCLSSLWVISYSFSCDSCSTYFSSLLLVWVNFSISNDFSCSDCSNSNSYALIPSVLEDLKTTFSLSSLWILCSISITIC